jgi:hypothetical protein
MNFDQPAESISQIHNLYINECCLTVAVIWTLSKVPNSAKRRTPSQPTDRLLCPRSDLRHRSFGDSKISSQGRDRSWDIVNVQRRSGFCWVDDQWYLAFYILLSHNLKGWWWAQWQWKMINTIDWELERNRKRHTTTIPKAWKKHRLKADA